MGLSWTMSEVGRMLDVTTHFRSGAASMVNWKEPDHFFSSESRCTRRSSHLDTEGRMGGDPRIRPSDHVDEGRRAAIDQALLPAVTPRQLLV